MKKILKISMMGIELHLALLRRTINRPPSKNCPTCKTANWAILRVSSGPVQSLQKTGVIYFHDRISCQGQGPNDTSPEPGYDPDIELSIQNRRIIPQVPPTRQLLRRPVK